MTIPRRYDAKFAVGSADGPRSTLWHVWRTKNEVYVVSSNMGAVEKLSFHSSGICRKAFVAERPKPDGMDDRAIHKWRRPAAPPEGAQSGTCVLEVIIPTNYLSTSFEETGGEPHFWIPPAPSGMSTLLEMYFTREKETVLRWLGEPTGRVVHVYTQLPTGEAFVVQSQKSTFGGENFWIPASHIHKNDFLMLEEDSNKTGRPLRMTMYSNPKDGDRLCAWEYGGYEALPGSVPGLEGLATFTRNTIAVSTEWKT
jgi:hypothetical protein